MRERDQSIHGISSPPSNLPISTVYQPYYVPQPDVHLSPMQVHFASCPSPTIFTSYVPQPSHQQHTAKVSICNLETHLYINIIILHFILNP